MERQSVSMSQEKQFAKSLRRATRGSKVGSGDPFRYRTRIKGENKRPDDARRERKQYKNLMNELY